MCLYPKLIKNRKYTITKKNKGNVPEVKDARTLWVPVGCQKCIECRKQKGRSWSVRLQEHIRNPIKKRNAKFVTLTFSNESIAKLIADIEPGLEGYDLDNEIATLAVRRFLERWRKKYKISIQHWLVTELGQPNHIYQGTENLHLHGILFTNEYKHNTPGIKEQYFKQQHEDIAKIWGYGHVFIGKYVDESSINYTIKYCTKVDIAHKEYNPKILTSPGIGSEYTKRLDAKLNKFNHHGETRETYNTRQNRKMNLPIYWRNKIYTEEEREKLWLQKLDKEERWVLGTRISTKEGPEAYYRALIHARAKNKRLGYGNDEINWNRRIYENNRRKLNIKKRLEKWEE